VHTLISLLLPSRGRPDLVKRFIQSILDTAIHPEAIEVILYLDNDDAENYANLLFPRIKYHCIVGENLTMGGYNDQCLAKSSGNIIMLVNDDLVIRTHGWDEKLREFDNSIPDKIYLVYVNDLFKSNIICTFPILSRRVCELIQDPYPVIYRGAFIDLHVMDIFKRLQKKGQKRIYYLADVVFEHLHYLNGKAKLDKTYQQRSRFIDDQNFFSLIPKREQAAKILANTILNLKSSSDINIQDAQDTQEYFVMPKNIIKLVLFIAKVTIFNKELPWSWRIFLWYRLTGRQLVARYYYAK
jgi:hypothetical protein